MRSAVERSARVYARLLVQDGSLNEKQPEAATAAGVAFWRKLDGPPFVSDWNFVEEI